MSSAGNAETTISAEGQYIINTLAFYIGALSGSHFFFQQNIYNYLYNNDLNHHYKTSILKQKIEPQPQKFIDFHPKVFCN